METSLGIGAVCKRLWSFTSLGPRWAWLQSAEWAWFGGLALGGFGVASVNEFGLAVCFFVLASISASSQMWNWYGGGLGDVGKRSIQIVGSVVIFGALVALIGVVNVYRDNRPWSQLPKAHANAIGLRHPDVIPISVSKPYVNRPPQVRVSSLIELFEKEAVRQNYGVMQDGTEISPTGTRLPFQAAFDRHTNVYYAEFYIPHSSNTVQDCLFLARDFDHNFFDKRLRDRHVAVNDGDLRWNSQEAKFSGLVIIYNYDFLTIPQQALVMNAFQKKDIEVLFHDSNYLLNFMHQHPDGFPPMPEGTHDIKIETMPPP